MIEATTFSGKTVAVLGLGRSGRAAARSLVAGGAEVRAWDDGPEARAGASAEKVPIIDLMSDDWARTAALVLSPGIPHTHPAPHPVVEKARAAGCEIISDIELLYRNRPDAAYLGVTGTNGKSTTTALLGHVLKAAGRSVEVGGNLGVPALDLAPLGADGLYLLEMSSYQLELVPSVVFDVAVLLNVSPDHLDRHGGMDGYVAAKRRIFHGQSAAQTSVVGVDDDLSRALCDDLAANAVQRVVPISAGHRAEAGVYVIDGVLHDATEGVDVEVVDLKAIATLPGVHNWQNAAAAYAAARAAGVAATDIAAAMRSYPGLVHRQERIATIDGVTFINDSKATNADATARALVCYDNIYWIAGGLPKEGRLAGLEPFWPRVRHAFLIGQAAEEFAATLAGQVEATISGDLETAVRQAFDAATNDGAADPVVLLSPACASFDQFKDFEQRGDVFRRLVDELDREGAA